MKFKTKRPNKVTRMEDAAANRVIARKDIVNVSKMQDNVTLQSVDARIAKIIFLILIKNSNS